MNKEFFLLLLLLCSGCSSITLSTNISEYMIANQIAKHDLYKFRNHQHAIEMGATMMGQIEGLSCTNYKEGRNGTVNKKNLKAEAQSLLKQDDVNRGANAYTIEQCKAVTYAKYECEKAYLCTGQSYIY